jgi:site-specific recombinase
MSDFFIKFYVDTRFSQLQEIVMARLEEYRQQVENLKTSMDAMFTRIDEDVAELHRKLDAGTLTGEDFAELESLIARVNAHDIDPDHPPMPDDDDEGEGEGEGEDPDA